VTRHALLDQLDEIDQTLLTQVRTSPPDPLTSKERTLTRSYLLVAHALLEEAIESIFVSHFDNARVAVSAGRFAPSTLLPLYAAALEWGIDIPTYHKRKWNGFLSSKLADAHVTDAVRKNHGLKEQNVQDLAKLVGIEWAVIDDAPGVSLAALSTLGAKRGVAGHTSLFSGSNEQLAGEEYPSNVREWVSQAAESVIELEDVVSRLSAPAFAEDSSPVVGELQARTRMSLRLYARHIAGHRRRRLP